MANEQQINVPSLVVILVLSGLIIRYLFFSPPTPQQAVRDPTSALRSREVAVERIQQMFPQVDRRTILWDLQRTGGDIAATTERILAGRLETPPVTFQPPPAPGSNTAGGSTTQSSQSRAARPAGKPEQPDLITRYKLKDKVSASSEGEEIEGSSEGSGKGAKGWSSNREERQTLLQKRRDQMILEARRKMEARMAAEKAAAEGR
ncbi:hypothetical protein QBC33DRAFT_515616 [Phialemonium atrogriseum]|uniref:Coupling of ubiquitin conjugation to ER degradation protein 1 n=1 Tax=Phialemonium atrogriseum TaxID=1093897 RepID=A0AAJ0C1B7_9PEZI|nr:uncharacterized protein QBC33DRAFT_515616 [Phialemonium atrogriseum]KAK1766867.1 hypothetical protein QBC33DRAFT_515616 [Phialemonium atrogriseum]